VHDTERTFDVKRGVDVARAIAEAPAGHPEMAVLRWAGRLRSPRVPGATERSPRHRSRRHYRQMARKDRDELARKGRRSRGHSAGGGVRRAVGLLALLPLASRAPIYARLVWALVLDDRTPASRKALLAGGLGYVLLGRDLIPDEVPLLGGLDDLVVVAIALDVFLDGIDPEVLSEKLDELGIDRAAFDEDVARIRRFLPGPVRRAMRRLPGLIAGAGEALQHSGLGPRLRGWITSDRGAVA